MSAVEAQQPIEMREAALASIERKIDLADRSAIASYGQEAQRKLADFAGRALEHARERPTAATAGLLGSLVDTAKGLDASAAGKGNLLERLFSTIEARLKKFTGQFEAASNRIEIVAVELEQHRDQLLKDIALLDTLFDETRSAITELDLYIAAGKNFVARAKQTSPGGLGAQQASDRRMAIERLDRRLLQLEQARHVGLQQLPQIRLVQASDETLVDNLQSAVTLTIPVWKQKMLMLLGIASQESALKLHETVTAATNRMIEQTSAMARDQALRIERGSQTGMLDVDVLERTNRELIDTISKVIELQNEGAAARAELEDRMAAMNRELRASLVALGSTDRGTVGNTAESKAG